MRDIPMFTTENGVASLTLSQIPYTNDAYIYIQDASQPEAFVKECAQFCKAAGAERVYASGHGFLIQYPVHATIVQMRCDPGVVGQWEDCLFPVQEQTFEAWREIYNQKMAKVPGSAYMSLQKKQEVLDGGYFVHRDGALLGIGMVSGNRILAVASVTPGGGKRVVGALCTLITDDSVSLDVALENKKAVCLYEQLGFIQTGILSVWHDING